MLILLPTISLLPDFLEDFLIMSGSGQCLIIIIDHLLYRFNQLFSPSAAGRVQPVPSYGIFLLDFDA